MLALVGGTLIDGTGAKPQEKTTIIIQGTTIKEVGAQNKVSIPPDAQTLDIAGKTFGAVHLRGKVCSSAIAAPGSHHFSLLQVGHEICSFGFGGEANSAKVIKAHSATSLRWLHCHIDQRHLCCEPSLFPHPLLELP